MKKGIVIAAILMFFVLSIALAQDEPAGEDIVVVGTDTGSEPAETSEEQPECETCTSESNIFTKAYGKTIAFGGWLITRDYGSALKNAGRWVLGLSPGIKIVIAIVILIILLIIWNYTLRNTKSNNMRWARRHHLKGEKAHREGDEETAKMHYERAREYREKAQDQW